MFTNPVPIGAGGGEPTGPGLSQQSIEGRDAAAGICATINGDGTISWGASYVCKAWEIKWEIIGPSGAWMFRPSQASTGRNVVALQSRARPPRRRPEPCPDPRDRPPCDEPPDDDDDPPADDDDDLPPPGGGEPAFRITAQDQPLPSGSQPVRVPVRLETTWSIRSVTVELLRGSQVIGSSTWEPVETDSHTFEISLAFSGQRCPCTVRAVVTRDDGQPFVFTPIARVR
jgi:hypothetical protein